MPIPIILAVVSGASALAGVVAGYNGANKIKQANDKVKAANDKHQKNIDRFNQKQKSSIAQMDEVGKKELHILNSFSRFSETFEKIQNKPQFKPIEKDGVHIPIYNKDELREVSIGAGIILASLGGSVVGTASAFAASGATTAAVIALGTASTGTAISSLSGAAATNAILATLGGGTLAAGGGGVALGSVLLGTATLGIGLLVGGIIFNITGKKISEQADEAWVQMENAQKEIDTICAFLDKLEKTANRFYKTLSKIGNAYEAQLMKLENIVINHHKTDWRLFNEDEQLITKNTIQLVSILYAMCKTQLVLVSKNKNESNKVNSDQVQDVIDTAESAYHKLNL